MIKMTYTVIEQWRPQQNDLCVLYLDKAKVVDSANDDYRNFRIGGITYEPVPMSHTNGKCIAIKGEGNFVGKHVEFV